MLEREALSLINVIHKPARGSHYYVTLGLSITSQPEIIKCYVHVKATLWSFFVIV
jgi:hypothetical protein